MESGYNSPVCIRWDASMKHVLTGQSVVVHPPVPVRGQDLTRHWWKMLIAMESRKLKVMLLICWACPEFCSRHKISGSSDSALVEWWTHDRKVLSSSPGRSSRRYFSPGSSFLFCTPIHPPFTAVSCKRFWPSAKKCRCQVTHTYDALNKVTL